MCGYCVAVPDNRLHIASIYARNTQPSYSMDCFANLPDLLACADLANLCTADGVTGGFGLFTAWRFW